ncbi:MAG TPA: SGNH/GDSL hydrolase family protein, partial [Solirubrobacteraceae bacterium]
MRRLVAVALLVLAAAPAAQADEPAFTTMPVSRFGGDQPGAGLEDVAGNDLRGRAADVAWIPVRVRPSRAVCAARGQWLLDGRPVRAAPDPPRQARGVCNWTLVVRGTGKHRLAVRAGGIAESREVVVKDKLVFTLGDSVASGEGNPRPRRGDRGPDRVWLERRCHRSSFSGFELAARRVARRSERRTSITFVNLACSGATIANGILGPYRGIERVAGLTADLPPQLDRLRALSARRGGKPDAIMISVGANDVRFGGLVALCASKPGCDRRALGGVPAAEALPDLIARLASQYDRLGIALENVVRTPEDILLTEYFNPTRDRNGELCTRSLGVARRDDLRFAEASLLLPLNDAVRVAARRNDYTHVSGIRRRFTRHGYCAGKQRWVVRVTESLLKSAGSPTNSRSKGTMHPNVAGHEAIADALMRPLAYRLDLPFAAAPARPPALDAEAAPKRDKGIPTWVWVAAGVVALLLLVLAFRDWATRVSLLFRPSGRADPVPMEAPPPAAASAIEAPWVSVLTTAVKALGAVASGTGLVLLLGGTILWVRFASVGAPAGQAVNAAGQREWLVTGWHALILFVLAAVVAVLIARVLDPAANATRPTRRGLALILAIELAVAVQIGDFRTSEKVQLVAGFLLATFLLHLLVDRAIPVGRILRSGRLDEMPGRVWRWFVGDIEGPHRGRLIAWRLAALVPLAAAIVAAATTDRDDRWLFIGVPLALAVVMFTARGGIAEHVEPRAGSGVVNRHLETPRMLLALTILTCLAILLGRDEIWLLGAAGAAGLLGLVCLVAASASGQRFVPYAAAIMVSVPLYGAVLFSIRAVDRPELQPLAAIGPDGDAVCGLYVGRTDGRIWYAELDLDENVPTNRAVRLRGRLTSIPDEDRTVMRVAPLQSLADAQVRAVRLRDELLSERGKPPGGPTCTTRPSRVTPPTRHERELRAVADRYAPDLLVSKLDGFPPTSVLAMFALHDRRRQLCRRVDKNHCLRVTHPGELPWNGGLGQYLDYPAKPRSKRG